MLMFAHTVLPLGEPEGYIKVVDIEMKSEPSMAEPSIQNRYIVTIKLLNDGYTLSLVVTLILRSDSTAQGPSGY